jgi:hypothetical protein
MILPKNTMVELIRMDDKLFKEDETVKMDEFTHYNSAPTVFEVFVVL